MNLLLTFRAEILKTRRTSAFYITLIAAAATPLIYLVTVCFDGLSPDESNDAMTAIFKRFEMTGLVIFPIFVMLLCTLLPQIEYRNNTWKQVFASPQTTADIFIAKMLNLHVLIVVFLVATHLFMFIAAVVTHFIIPDLKILHQPLNVYKLLVSTLNAYICLLGVIAIQFWLGLRCKNFIVPLAIWLSLWLMGTLMVLASHSPYAIYFPYSFHVFPNVHGHHYHLNRVEWTSAGYAVLFLILGFIDFSRRRVKA